MGEGYAPYQESAFKAALRLLGGAARGIAAVPAGGNVADSFGAGYTASANYSDAARQAAQEYAMRRAEAERREREDEIQSRYMEAQIKQLEKPPKPEKPEKLEPWQRTPEEQAKILDYEKRHKIATTPPEKPAKPDRSPILDYNTLLDNFRADKDVQNYTVVRDNVRRIEGALQQGTGFGDLSAIFAFMRVLDPTSVVRETEFKNAEEASGWLQRTLNLPGKAVSGNRLTPQARAKLGSMARSLHLTQKQTYDRKAAQYKKISKKFGVDESLIIPEYGEDAPQPATGDPLDAFYR